MLYESNRRSKEIILANGHLVPDELLESASCLVAHYDIWLKRYEEATLGERKLRPDERFELGFADLSFEPCAVPNVLGGNVSTVFERFRKDVKKDG
jgi:hypothetical protein